jgi:hypothetical protein
MRTSRTFCDRYTNGATVACPFARPRCKVRDLPIGEKPVLRQRLAQRGALVRVHVDPGAVAERDGAQDGQRLIKAPDRLLACARKGQQ